jgi:histone deacetylase 6
LAPLPSSASPSLVPGAQPPASGHETQISSINSNTNSSSSLPKTITRTGFVYDMQMMLHCQDGYIPTTDDVTDSGEGHPEEPMRIKRIFARLREAGLIGRMKKLPIEQVTEEQVALVHSPGHWDKVQGTECTFFPSFRPSFLAAYSSVQDLHPFVPFIDENDSHDR